jgi:hypothetical protein
LFSRIELDIVRCARYQQKLEEEREKLKLRHQSSIDVNKTITSGVDVQSIRARFKGNSVITTQQTFLQKQNEETRKARLQQIDWGKHVSIASTVSVEKLQELYGDGGGIETEETFRLRQAQMRKDYQNACDAALAGIRGYRNNGTLEEEFIRAMAMAMQQRAGEDGDGRAQRYAMLEAWARHMLEEGEDCRSEGAKQRFLQLLERLGMEVRVSGWVGGRVGG